MAHQTSKNCMFSFTSKFVCLRKNRAPSCAFVQQKGLWHVKIKCTPASENISTFYVEILESCFFSRLWCVSGVSSDQRYACPTLPKPALHWKYNDLRSEKTPSLGAKVTTEPVHNTSKCLGWPAPCFHKKWQIVRRETVRVSADLVRMKILLPASL